MELLKVTEVAKELNVTRQAIYNWINDGKLKSVKFQHVIRVRREDLNEFMNF